MKPAACPRCSLDLRDEALPDGRKRIKVIGTWDGVTYCGNCYLELEWRKKHRDMAAEVVTADSDRFGPATAALVALASGLLTALDRLEAYDKVLAEARAVALSVGEDAPDPRAGAGLYEKFSVFRSEDVDDVTSQIRADPLPGCFVLRPEKDLSARLALAAYAQAAILDGNHKLARDLRAWLDRLERENPL